MSWLELAQSVLALFIIIDPFLSLSVFLGLTAGQDRELVKKQVITAVGVAAIMLIVFLITGNFLLKLLNISFESFKIGGGIILLLLGVRTCLGKGFTQSNKYKISIVVIGTPMLSGPGALTTVIVLTNQFGFWVTALASFIVLAITWVILYYAYLIEKVASTNALEVFSRIMGLLLTGLGVQYIIGGVRTLILKG